MKKFIIPVPKGIRYISDWKGYDLRNYAFPHILNKTLTGCGYTEYCIKNCQDLIICSPRKILLENKEDQHPGEVFYARSGLEKSVDFEKDLLTIKKGIVVKEEEITEKKKLQILEFKNRIVKYYFDCKVKNIPCKILVTYDSYRHVKEALGDYIRNFQVVIDEFQSILIDAKFKSSTELDFLNQIRDLQRVCFVSATPIMDKYLERLDEFKNLPYYELDWITEDPGRVIHPDLKVKTYNESLTGEIAKVIEKYQQGKFETWIVKDKFGPKEIKSKEAVLYVNSVKTICSVIKKCKLTPGNTNILCARTSENEKKVRDAFNDVLRKLYPDDKRKRITTGMSCIGSVPKRGEPHKMFTLCTRTVYLGADFYSTCARTFVFSDANIDCLCVDVSMDLEQILGRQRLDENPWKNSANVFIKLSTTLLTKEDFDRELDRKIKETQSLLRTYMKADDGRDKLTLADRYEKLANTFNYKDDYVAVNKYSGATLKPTFNNLMLIADERTFEIQQMDYKDRFSVYNTLTVEGYNVESIEVGIAVSKFEKLTNFVDQMTFVVDQEKILRAEDFIAFLNYVPGEFRNFIEVLGTDEIRACSYQRSKIFEKWSKVMNTNNKSNILKTRIYTEFQEGKKYSKSEIKQKLREIYTELGYNKTPKALDLLNFFNINSCKITNKETGKRDHGFEIMSRK